MEIESLSNYELWQLEKYGNIIYEEPIDEGYDEEEKKFPVIDITPY